MVDQAPNEAGVPAEQPQVVDESHGAGIAHPQVAVPVQQISKFHRRKSSVLNLKNGHDGLSISKDSKKRPNSTKRTEKTR